jgi:hypothetical protein
MSKALKNIPLDHALYIALFIASIIHIPIYEDSTSQSTLNIYHLLVVILSFTFIICLRVILKINKWITVFFLYLTIITSYSIATKGINIRFSLLIFSATSLVLSFYFSYRHETNIRSLGKLLFACIIMFLLIRNLIFAQEITSIYSRTRNDGGLFFMASGGRNIEATLLGLASIFLIRTKFFPAAIAIALASSYFMMSRAGLIASALSLFAFYYIRGWYYLLLLTTIAVPFLLFVPFYLDSELLSRFNIQSEVALQAENQGRLSIWINSIALAKSNVFGSGVGFGFDLLRHQSGVEYRENNFHNIFIQFLVESGHFGLVLFLGSMVSTLRCAYAINELESFWFILTYLFLGLVQFTGYEVFFWLVIGHVLGRYHSLGKKSEQRFYFNTKHTPTYNTKI